MNTSSLESPPASRGNTTASSGDWRHEPPPRVSMFANAFASVPEDTDLGAILQGVRTGRWRDPVEAIRRTYAAALAATGDAKKAKCAIYEPKKRLPAFCMSGTAKSRTEPLDHSGVLQVDLDILSAGLPAVREKMKADPYIAFGFVSPSGDGLKCGLRIDASRHADSFTAAQNYFWQRYGLEIDPEVKDLLRLCFVSYDSAAWTNPEAEPLPLPAGTVGRGSGNRLSAMAARQRLR